MNYIDLEFGINVVKLRWSSFDELSLTILDSTTSLICQPEALEGGPLYEA
jgi:hypothetical protein